MVDIGHFHGIFAYQLFVVGGRTLRVSWVCYSQDMEEHVPNHQEDPFSGFPISHGTLKQLLFLHDKTLLSPCIAKAPYAPS